MPSIDQVFTSNWFNHADVGDLGSERTYQIETVAPGEIRDKKSGTIKPQMNIRFVGEPKMFGCNKTNTRRIAALYGKDYSQWPGQWVTLVHTTVDFGGEEVSGIRVKPVKPQPRSQGFPTPPHVQGMVQRQKRQAPPLPDPSYGDGPGEEYDPLG
jgi:hypothetical protein